MKLQLHFEDTEYPYKGFDHLRKIARAIVFNDEGRIYIHHIQRDDVAGKFDYFETPGGGVDDGESFEEAVVRECKEELGSDIEIIKEIAVVEDAYNLFKRKNENHYFLAKEKSLGKKHFVSDGDSLIVETLLLSIDEAIERYESTGDYGLYVLVKRRELPILKALKEGILGDLPLDLEPSK